MKAEHFVTQEQMTGFIELASPQYFMLRDLKNNKMAMTFTLLFEMYTTID